MIRYLLVLVSGLRPAFLILLAVSCQGVWLSAHAGSLAELVPAGDVSQNAAFGMAEFPSGSFEGLPQWKRVLDDSLLRRQAFQSCKSSPASCPDATTKTWTQVVAQASTLSPMEQLKWVNSHFNKWAYILDDTNYGVSEYWATVEEFLARSGDCEDYAIAKFFALRELGFSNDQLRIFAVLDTIRNLGHAVLVVQIDGKYYVMDIYNEIVTSDDFYKHYSPKYSVNETERFLHAPSF